MIPEVLSLILEIIGTVAFALSGSIVAAHASLDIFGVVFIGSVTAIGGGILRDILMGKFPPAIFLRFNIFLIAVLTSVVLFVFIYIKRKKYLEIEERIEAVNNFFDAIGLAAFSVMGTEAAISGGFESRMFFCIALGMITGIGGGIFRDILTAKTPYVFRKHVYAVASILGAAVYYILRVFCGMLVGASVISMLFIVTLRMLATKFRWSLPKVKL